LIGVSAINIGGKTIDHIITGFYQAKKIKIVLNRARIKLGSVKVVILDEISMIPMVYIYALDCMLRKAKGANLPMGGVHVIGMFVLFYLLEKSSRASSS